MAYISITNTLADGNTAYASEVMTNFTDIVNGLQAGAYDVNMLNVYGSKISGTSVNGTTLFGTNVLGTTISGTNLNGSVVNAGYVSASSGFINYVSATSIQNVHQRVLFTKPNNQNIISIDLENTNSAVCAAFGAEIRYKLRSAAPGYCGIRFSDASATNNDSALRFFTQASAIAPQLDALNINANQQVIVEQTATSRVAVYGLGGPGLYVYNNCYAVTGDITAVTGAVSATSVRATQGYITNVFCNAATCVGVTTTFLKAEVPRPDPTTSVVGILLKDNVSYACATKGIDVQYRNSSDLVICGIKFCSETGTTNDGMIRFYSRANAVSLIEENMYTDRYCSLFITSSTVTPSNGGTLYVERGLTVRDSITASYVSASSMYVSINSGGYLYYSVAYITNKVECATLNAGYGIFSGYVTTPSITATTVSATTGLFGKVSCTTAQATYGLFTNCSATSLVGSTLSATNIMATTVSATTGLFGKVSCTTAQATYGLFTNCSATSLVGSTLSATNIMATNCSATSLVGGTLSATNIMATNVSCTTAQAAYGVFSGIQLGGGSSSLAVFESGTFECTFTGLVSAQTFPCYYNKIGNSVTVYLDCAAKAASSTGVVIKVGTFPVSIRPAAIGIMLPGLMWNGSAGVPGYLTSDGAGAWYLGVITSYTSGYGFASVPIANYSCGFSGRVSLAYYV